MKGYGDIVGVWLTAVLVAAPVAAGRPEPEYRTRIPEVTPARWTTKPPAVGRPGKVSREGYMEFIKRTYERSRDSALRTAGSPDNRHQYVFARSEAFFSLVEKDAGRAQTAMKFVRGDYAYRTQGKGADVPSGFNVFPPAVQGCCWLRANPAVSPEDREFLIRWLRLLEERHGTYEYGAMNRSAGSAVGREFLALLLPADPGTPERRRYADTVWNDWWPFRDTFEILDGAGKVQGRSQSFAGDEVRHPVQWVGPVGLSGLAGKPVVLRFRLRSASLYAFAFRSGSQP